MSLISEWKSHLLNIQFPVPKIFVLRLKYFFGLHVYVYISIYYKHVFLKVKPSPQFSCETLHNKVFNSTKSCNIVHIII